MDNIAFMSQFNSIPIGSEAQRGQYGSLNFGMQKGKMRSSKCMSHISNKIKFKRNL